MKSEENVFVASIALSRIRQVLQQVLKGCKIEPLEFGYLDDVPDFGCVAEKPGLIGGSSVVQIAVYEDDGARQVHVVPVWDSGFSRAWSGLGNSVSQSGSKKLAERVIDALKAADPKLTAAGAHDAFGDTQGPVSTEGGQGGDGLRYSVHLSDVSQYHRETDSFIQNMGICLIGRFEGLSVSSAVQKLFRDVPEIAKSQYQEGDRPFFWNGDSGGVIMWMPLVAEDDEIGLLFVVGVGEDGDEETPGLAVGVLDWLKANCAQAAPIVKGFVDDESLARFAQNCRLLTAEKTLALLG